MLCRHSWPIYIQLTALVNRMPRGTTVFLTIIADFLHPTQYQPPLCNIYLIYWLLSYSAVLCSSEDSLRSCSNEWLWHSIACFEYPLKCCPYSVFGYYMAGGRQNCCHLNARSVYTIQPSTSLQCHFMQSHIFRVCMCLAVTCHVHFWQCDWDLLCATVVTQGRNGYQSKSQHRKLTLEKKFILLGLKPVFLWTGVQRSTTELSPLPIPHFFSTFITPGHETRRFHLAVPGHKISVILPHWVIRMHYCFAIPGHEIRQPCHDIAGHN